MQTRKTLGQIMRELREKKDLSLRELAKKIGVSAAFLSDVELDRRYPSDKHLRTLARSLGTPLENLRKHDTRPPIRDFRRLAISDPEFAFAFRRVLDEKITPKELIDLAEKRSVRQKKKLKHSFRIQTFF